MIFDSGTMFSRKLLIVIPLLAISFLLFIPLVSQAGFVPCGLTGDDPNQPGNQTVECTACHLFILTNNIIKFIAIDIVPILGAILLAAGGFMWMTAAGDENRMGKGKKILTGTIIGLVVVFASFMIVGFILQVLVGENAEKYFSWKEGGFVIKCSTEVSRGGNVADWGALLDSPDHADGISTNTEGYRNYVNMGNTGLRTTSLGSATYNRNVDNYVRGANLNGVEPNRVKAIINAESSGNPNAINRDTDGQVSCGLMQVRPDTARIYDPSAKNLSDEQVCQKLRDDPNYNVDVGTHYYSDLYRKYGSHDLAAAAYNGGPMANKPSVNCPGSYRWQCEWDNNEHTLPNEGYRETRNYVRNINSVYAGLSR